MRIQTLAHLSDLHVGLSAATDLAAGELCSRLVATEVDHVVVTGDLTQRGRDDEFDRFRRAFTPLYDSGRMTLIPGNHDRWAGDDLARRIMHGEHVDVVERPGLYMVRVDSSGPHNLDFWASHGVICRGMLRDIDLALARAPREALCAVLLHHHPLPQPPESLPERVAALLGWPDVGELGVAQDLLAMLAGRCDLVLHGHRHVPLLSTLVLAPSRPLRVLNAGSSTKLGRGLLLPHVAGGLACPPRWMDARQGVPQADAVEIAA
jgi:3',5'-cyclic AMP phosphodiesterase CpdA